MNSDQEDGIKDVRDELEMIAANGTEVFWRQERARQVRFNEWEGQSTDGRKHEEDLDGEALPFEGAPDNRIPLVDGAITEKVILLKRGFWRATMQGRPVESDGMERAQNINALLSWLRDRAMREELESEVELAAQYMFGDDPGVAVLEVCWLRDLGLVRRSLTFEDLATMFATGAQAPEDVQQDDPRQEAEMMGEFMDLATNPDREAEWIDWLESMFPGATRKALRQAARELRKSGQAELPVPAIRENRPSVRALKLFDDIFFPVGTVDIQRARGVHRREWLTEVELQERVHTLGWDRSWVDDVIERGKGQSLLSYPLRWRQWAPWSSTLSGPGRAVNERDNLFEVWWSYRREADELGVPGITCTTWSCVVKDRWARKSVADYPDGKYPFVLRPREQLGRQMTDSRGLSVAITTHQNEIKVQRDARGAHVQLLASPPAKVKISRGAYQMVLGPNAQVPVQKMDDFDLVEMPNFMQNSVEMEETTRQEAELHCALMRKDADPNRVSLFQQEEVDNFSALWRAAFVKVLGLAQTFYSEEELDRVTGQNETPLHLTPEDIRGGWDVAIEIDARDLNMEFAMKKMKAYGEVLSLDSGGQLDRGPFIQWAAQAIDPILARRSIQPPGAASKKLMDEERANAANAALGIEPIMNPDGTTNPQMRLQVLMQTIGQSPRLAPLFGQDELFTKIIQNYQKYLIQQGKQDENKVIGRLGTEPMQSVQGLYQGGAPAMPAA